MDAAGIVLFYAFGALALVSALAMVLQRNPTYSAFALVLVMCSLAVIFGLLGSPFIAALQVIVYAGAVMVLFLFVLMLLNVQREVPARSPGGSLRLVAAALAGLLVAEVGSVLWRAGLGPAAAGYEASTAKMAPLLFSYRYLYAFEATSVLILAALVGAVVLARRSAP